MQITVQKHSSHLVIVSPQGRFDAFSAPEVRARFDHLLDEGHVNFVIDLSPTSFLDSAGIAVLVGLLKQARPAGGDVWLVWPALEAARRILMLTRFDKIFGMFETAEAAAASLRRLQ